ncbi:MAG TPA: thioredoxin-like domain-containing protein [Gemmataceae bacterium]|nr:thioredoxin-like domain-containing protein [Gemmataceae bacterium]
MSSTVTPPGPASPASARWGVWLVALLVPALVCLAVYAIVFHFPGRTQAVADDKAADGERGAKDDRKDEEGDVDRKIEAPELEGGVGWLNTASPLKLKDLRGKFVLLDFWTFCCINCLHTLPDLAKLEKKYADQLVVIGVHSAKFENEKDSENIRKAILRYEINHPVVNDANMRIWRTYLGTRGSWPTLVLIDPEGNAVWLDQGEGHYEELDRLLTRLSKVHRKRKTLNEKPIRFELARFSENGSSPLFFPGKVLADAASKRLFIADSTHHRIVITDLDGKKIAVAGTGEAGLQDGAFDKARFNDPQGMALKGETLYVADRKNHSIRALDLKKKTVRLVAGTGEQGSDRQGSGDALKTALNSPWDVYLKGNDLFIAMAGYHQIWKMDLDKGETERYAGLGLENIRDGTLARSLFAQPSGLTSDGTTLYVADSEVSGIRAVPMDGKGEVKTIVGEGLFDFGDIDGTGDQVRLQHALGVVWAEGKLYVADTYNSKLKVIDPEKKSCRTFVGGEPDGWLAGPLFSEPGGLSYANGKLYVADTNAHRIRVVDLKTKKVATLKLQGVDAPKVP